MAAFSICEESYLKLGGLRIFCCYFGLIRLTRSGLLIFKSLAFVLVLISDAYLTATFSLYLTATSICWFRSMLLAILGEKSFDFIVPPVASRIFDNMGVVSCA